MGHAMDGSIEPGVLPVGERFVLWAVRQWHCERALPAEGSLLHRGFQQAGLIALLPDFAIAMDAYLFGARRAMEINEPTCPGISRDEATLVALCGLAQGRFDGSLTASLDHLMAPTASRAAAARLTTFAVSLGHAGLMLAPETEEASGRLH
jgi:hypothetical protein